jgi:putative transposase
MNCLVGQLCVIIIFVKRLDNKRLKAFKYRIYPNLDQENFFSQTFGCVRFVYNKMLEEKLQALENKQKIPQITPAKYKKEYTFLQEVDSLALMNAMRNLDNAFKNFFKNKKHFGLPKFRKKKGKQKYMTNNVNNNIKIDFENQLLFLPKLKRGVKIKLHRKFEGRIVSVTISKTRSGNYYASILVELPNPEDVKNKTKQPKNRVCGIDLGLYDFITITNDNGTQKISHPKYLRKAEKKLKKLQRRLSRKKRGSNNYEKARIRLAKCYEYVENARNDFLHKLSKAIIDDNQVIVAEDLNIKGMIKNKHLSKSISDSGFGKFMKYLEYKANWYGRELIIADRFYPSSKLCSICGYKNNKLKLSDRYWTCPVCRTSHDRDANASINLYRVGLERPEFTPVEHALVDDRIPVGYLKSHHALKQEALPSIG